METALTCLLECLGEHIVAESVDLDIHLASGNTVAGTGYLEVHVAKVVLIAEDV